MSLMDEKCVSLWCKTEQLQMLEFKNTSVHLSGGGESKPFSLVVNDGDIVCVAGARGLGKSRLLRAVLGMEPVANGYITFDGEIVSPWSAAYFRKMIAYIPQDLPSGKLRLGELFRMLFQLDANLQQGVEKEKLLSVWHSFGIDSGLYDKTLDCIPRDVLQNVYLSFLPLLDRKVILIDGIMQNEMVEGFLADLASTGAEIIYSCRENRMKCNKIVNLN